MVGTRRSFAVVFGAGLMAGLDACSAHRASTSTVPRRLVSTAPSITETLFALGAGKRVVGVTDFCHYPPEVRSIAKVGSFLNPSPEAILALRPDLVLILKNPIRLAQRLEAMGLRVLEVSTDSIADIQNTIRKIAAAIGQPATGDRLAASIESSLERIRAATAGLPRRRIAFIVGRNPGTLEGLVAVGSASYHGDAMRLAGTENIFAGASAQYPKVSLEEMLARNPEVILDMGDMTMTDNVTEAHKQNVVRLWQRYPVISAVKSHRVYAVASDVFVVPGPRVVDAALEIARLAHPEAGL
ncbi:MAG: helical backbone metal receptor [Acidobacteria bacterium]|nr:helical backbone metal receptor [Acidobacteriota bacterium]